MMIHVKFDSHCSLETVRQINESKEQRLINIAVDFMTSSKKKSEIYSPNVYFLLGEKMYQ